MALIYLIRHGETDWNRQRKLQGHTDIALNDRGREQAQSLAPFFRSLRFDELLSSDLKRACQTARIATSDLPMRETPLLREINLGQAEGLTREEIQARWPDLWVQWTDLRFHAYGMRFPDGESRREALGRLFALFKRERTLLETDARVGFFTHGLFLRTFAQWSVPTEEALFSTPNCCVYEWEWDWRELNFDSPPEDRPRLRQIHLLPEESLSL